MSRETQGARNRRRQTQPRPSPATDRRVDRQCQKRQNRKGDNDGRNRTNVTLENRDDRGAVRLGLRNEADIRRTTVAGLVDTGAVSLSIPEEIATELRLAPEGARTVNYADEHREQRPVTSVTITIGNLTTSTQAFVGLDGSQVLIEQVVFELLDLIADCRNRTLTPRHSEGPVQTLR